MIIKLFKHLFVPIIIVFIVTSSIVLKISPMIIPLVIAGAFFLFSILLDGKGSYIRICQIVFLGLFHWFSHLNWCQLLYFSLVVIAFQKKRSILSALGISSFYFLEYTAIRLSYQPITTYTLLISVNDMLAYLLVIVLFRYVLISEQEKKILREKTNFLKKYDPLTGLLNYEGYIERIQYLVRNHREFVLITIDFQDFKSFNSQSFHTGNEILVNMSLVLKALFVHSLALSRYAGDRFAIALPRKENITAEIDHLLSMNKLGFQVTYSLSQFPQEAATATDLIALTEDKLFQNKRSIWIGREEQRFQEEKLRAVGELAAGMAHEIRNPLTTIKGFMQISRDNDYKVKPWFDLIMSEITRMTELTAEFLQFSKPHISDMKRELINNFIDRVLSLTESEAALRGHLIIHEVLGESIYVLLDRDKIVQVLLNLVRNSFEAMEQPGIVRIRLKLEGESCLIEIEDNGCGIPENELNTIFNPFYTTKKNGTGLGLSICKKIIQDHNGSLQVKSELGVGSVFSIRLPTLKLT